ncbi:MAG: pyridine nucleotide-disulfide oxidoreductase/dicluster-binding protein [Clostridium sp.]
MSFLEDFEKTLAEKCRQNEPPFCQAVCPFRLDIKGLEEKWKKGRFNAAYRTYQNTVGFPGIVAKLCDRPCEKACLRARLDGAVQLGLLEQATIAYARRKTPNAYNLPSKGKKIAIIGGGLSGLGCALRLCNKKYEVTVFEKADFLGGHARSLMDSSEFDGEIENQFQFEDFERQMGTEITDLGEIVNRFDAVYVATGKDGNQFGLEPDPEGAFATTAPGVFLGGSLTGSSTMKALADGLFASLAIERYLKTGGMNEPVLREGTLLELGTDGIEPAAPVIPAEGQAFSEEEAEAEISRCVKCSCDACMRACDLMRLHNKTPRRLYEEVYITIHPGTLSRDGTWATRLISTCDHCGLCKSVCPQHIDFGTFLLESMRAMHKKGAMPWPFHDFWLRDMEFSSGKAEVCRKPEGVEKSPYAFFPGCQLAASDAAYVTKTYGWLLEKQPDTAIWMTCCGAPAEWAGDESLYQSYLEKLQAEWEELGRPTIIFACPNCRKLFQQYLPEMPGVFLSEVMEQWGLPEMKTEAAGGNTVYGLFDPCAGRDFPELRESVRRLGKKAGICFEELPYEGEKARCCGYGGHIHIAAPSHTMYMTKSRSEEKELPYLTYCVNCRESFAGQHKEAVHFLDLLFGLNSVERPSATVTERRENRLKARKELLETWWHETVEEESHMDLKVEKELERKLSDSQILISDMEEVITFCERENRGATDPETGHVIGHLKIQNMTYWAEYEVLPEGGYRLWNGYAHRMNLEGE